MHTERTLILVQLLSPPLPILCVNSGDREGDRVSNSHDLIYSILGRLLSIPEEDADSLKRVASEAGFDGDFKRHVLTGKHATTLLEAIRPGQATGGKKKPVTDDEMYQHFCAYTRSVISILTMYDLASISSASQWKGNAGKIPTLDIKFLNDIGRVSFSTRPALVMSSIDFCCSFVVLRDVKGVDVEEVRTELMRIKDYQRTTLKCMRLVAREAGGILEAEKEMETVVISVKK